MPARRIIDQQSGRAAAGTGYSGLTLFDRMQRVAQGSAQMPSEPPATSYVNRPSTEGRDLVVLETASTASTEMIRFSRAEVSGQPGVVMQQRNGAGEWRDLWSLPTQSLDAREGMMGWLDGQSHRWERFGQMLRRRGAEELTAWIFELMVVPETSYARPPRHEPQDVVKIDQYGHRIQDGCLCRPVGIQHARYSARGYC